MQRLTHRERETTDLHLSSNSDLSLGGALLVKSLWKDSKCFFCCSAVLLRRFCYSGKLYSFWWKEGEFGALEGSLVWWVWTWRTGHMGSIPSNTACMTPSNLFGLSDPLSPLLRANHRHISTILSRAWHSLTVLSLFLCANQGKTKSERPWQAGKCALGLVRAFSFNWWHKSEIRMLSSLL